MRTNCDNCGAVLVDGKCEYCKSVWFEPGTLLGEAGIVSNCTTTYSNEMILVSTFGDIGERYIKGRTSVAVTLEIVGLTPDEAQRIHDAIMEVAR